MKKKTNSKNSSAIALVLLACLTLIVGCADWQHRATVIDWVDFVKTDDGTYTNVSNGVLRDPDTVTRDVVGEVRKKLDGSVHNPAYRSKPGDAAYLEKGTELYQVDGFAPEDLVAVQSDNDIGGYRLYANDEYDRLPKADFKSIVRAEPSSVSVYAFGEVQPIRVASGEQGKTLTEMLRQAVYTPDYPSDAEQEPALYQIVFDTGEPILYRFYLTDDGDTVRFRSDYQVKDDIRDFLKIP
ncbi:hypothetical protein [Saccharibacillus endophyticus]|uniref:Lipoprotein n=1 Tax=Saccharibacillus endophyticus TaxID=2060666 RepID=A0ABQ1ZUE4_9BACL|nr:hypothetical protein [Saccharibacillus endophyticus]GGH77708.1 hypothetical protein GCM10007362_21870 [Saccharibacillus endophyticus]